MCIYYNKTTQTDYLTQGSITDFRGDCERFEKNICKPLASSLGTVYLNSCYKGTIQ